MLSRAGENISLPSECTKTTIMLPAVDVPGSRHFHFNQPDLQSFALDTASPESLSATIMAQKSPHLCRDDEMTSAREVDIGGLDHRRPPKMRIGPSPPPTRENAENSRQKDDQYTSPQIMKMQDSSVDPERSTRAHLKRMKFLQAEELQASPVQKLDSQNHGRIPSSSLQRWASPASPSARR